MNRIGCWIACLVFSAATVAGQESWSVAVSPTTQALWGVAWGNGAFVAVGENGTILTSPDGLAWTVRPSGTSAWLVGVASANNQFVAVGANGVLLTSPDGRTWTSRPSGTTERLNAVAFGNDRWLAVGERGSVTTSSDGFAWRTPAEPSAKLSSGWLRGLCFGYGQFLATGENGAIVATADAENFFDRSIQTQNFFEGVVFARHTFVAVGANALILTSPDAVSWRWTDVPVAMRAIVFFNNQFVGAAGSGAILTSPDGTNWTTRATGSSSTLLALAGGPTTLVAVGLNGTILRSTAAQSAPMIVSPPASIAGVAGDGAAFSVVATGTSPLSYQWSRDNLPITGATTDTLAYSHVTGGASAGSYTVTVANRLGSVTSAAAIFAELPAAPSPTEIIDPTFATAGVPSERPAALLELPDGKILVGGRGFLIRLNPDGSNDPTFAYDPDLAPVVTINHLVRQSDGRVLAAGGYTPLPGEPGPPLVHLARYDTNGTRDPGFIATAALPRQAILQLVLQPDGKILVVNGTTRLQRLNADGSSDATFQSIEIEAPLNGTRSSISAKLAALAADGRIWVAGSDESQFGGSPFNGCLLRLRSDGVLDPTFTVTPTGYASSRLLSVLPNGRVLSASLGFVSLGGGWRLERRNADGSPDLTFTAQGGMYDRYGGNMRAALEADGSIVVVGTARVSWQISRFRPDGSKAQTLALADADERFSEITAVAPLADGRLLVGGATGRLRDSPKLARLVARNATAVNAPVIVSEPNPRVVTVGGGDVVTLAVGVAGAGPLSYSWDGRNVDSAITTPNPATLLTTIGLSGDLKIDRIRLSGTYIARITNAGGTVSSPPFVVRVAPRAPEFVQPPVSAVARPGRLAEFTADFLGSGPITYQWLCNGRTLDGPATPRFGPTTLPVYGLPENLGTYQLVVTNRLGTITSAPVALTLDTSPRLANVATRGVVGGGDRDLIVGFAIGGTTPKRVLLRALGPSLAQFGVGEFLADPALAVFDSRGTRLDGNDNATSDAATAFSQMGLFSLPAGTRDAALLRRLAPGTYTMQVSGVGGGTGVALAEVYEDDNDAGHLTNLSARVFVGTGDRVTIPGIVISGVAPKTILLRAVGATLAPFGVSGTLADPALTLVDSRGVALGANDDWGAAANSREIATAAARTGAFALPANSRDAALLVIVPPGSYTALVTGVGTATGIALVEVYEVN